MTLKLFVDSSNAGTKNNDNNAKLLMERYLFIRG